MKKIHHIFIIFLIFQFVILIGYYNFINFGNQFSLSFLFDEEFVIMLAIALVFFLFFNVISSFFTNFLNERVILLEKSFINSYDLILDYLNNLLNLLNKLSLSLNNNLFILAKLDEHFFHSFSIIEAKQFLIQNFFFQFLYLHNLILSKKF